MPLPVEQRVRNESLALVVFGATGDLATKKLFPAVFSLHHQVPGIPTPSVPHAVYTCEWAESARSRTPCACGDHTRGLPHGLFRRMALQTLALGVRCATGTSVKMGLNDMHTSTDRGYAHGGWGYAPQGFLPPKTLIVGETSPGHAPVGGSAARSTL
jgi:hypothetical protein